MSVLDVIVVMLVVAFVYCVSVSFCGGSGCVSVSSSRGSVSGSVSILC